MTGLEFEALTSDKSPDDNWLRAEPVRSAAGPHSRKCFLSGFFLVSVGGNQSLAKTLKLAFSQTETLR
jgi:hypothetical protein